MTNKEILTHNNPALSENPILRYFTFITLYFSQGIPEGLTLFAIPAWMAMNGKSAIEIAAYSAVVILPFSFKILLAPLMEKYTYLPMGRRRPWLLFGQFGILSSLIALSFVPNPLDNISLITVCVLCVHLFIMFQDIATDSLVIDIVPIEQQGKANSFMWGSKTMGTSVSLFAGSYLINQFNFSSAVLIMAAPVILIMLVPLFVKERKGEKMLPWTKGKTSPDAAFLTIDSWQKLFKSFKQVVFLKNTLLLLVIVFIAAGALHYVRTLLPIFTIKEQGWNNIFYSNIFSTYNLIGGIIGMFLGALVIQKFGIVRLIQGSCILMAALAFAMAFSKHYWGSSFFVSGFIATFCTLLTLINIGLLALAMHLCWKRISALQFTFFMTIFNAGLAAGAALLGYLRSHFDWQFLFIVFGVMILISMFVLKFIKTSRHIKQVETLENNYLDVLKAEGSLLVKSETV